MTKLQNLKSDLHKLADPNRAQHSMRYFKTAPGQYGHGDIFIGLTVPQSRAISKKYADLALSNIQKLLSSKIHEERQIALMILRHQFNHSGPEDKKQIIDFYLKNLKFVNNWDLVDGSAEMLWEFYGAKCLPLLKKFAKSKNMWERRIAILSTFPSSKAGDPLPTFAIAKLLLKDSEDLIHKAVGWMLREAGKHCGQLPLEEFLQPVYRTLPRTMLRYSIERFPEKLRRQYIEGKI